MQKNNITIAIPTMYDKKIHVLNIGGSPCFYTLYIVYKNIINHNAISYK